MKPERLEMTGFGSFKNKTVVDFSKLGDDGLFLITGATGAGKSTIFDAISVSLYGKPNTPDRATDSMKSDYTEATATPIVDFTFTHRGKAYRIERRLPHLNSRNNRAPGSATIWCGNEVLGTGYTKVTEIIEKQVLNLSYEHFSQITMIAQGTFRDVLTAGTQERTKLLQSIFMTRPYEDMGSKLKGYAQQALAERDGCATIIKDRVEGISCATPEDEDVKTGFLDDLKEVNGARKSGTAEVLLSDKDRILDFLDDLTSRDDAEMKRLKKVISFNNDKITDLTSRISLADEGNRKLQAEKDLEDRKMELDKQKPEVEKDRQKLEKEKKALHLVKPDYDRSVTADRNLNESQRSLLLAEDRLSAAERQVGEANAEVEKAKDYQKELETLKSQIQDLEKQMEKYALRDRLKTMIQNAQSTLDRIEEQKKKNQENQEDNDKLIECLRKSVGQLAGLQKEKAEADARTEKADRHKKFLDHSLSDLKELAKEREKLKKAQDTFQEDYLAYEKANHEYEDADKLFQMNQAGILAENLKEGDACPVCGSTSHPHLAHTTGEKVSSDDLDRLKEEVNAAAGKKDQSKEHATALLSALRTKETAVRESLADTLPQICESWPQITLPRFGFDQTEQLPEERKEYISLLGEDLDGIYAACKKHADEIKEKIVQAEKDQPRLEMAEKTAEGLKSENEKLFDSESKAKENAAAYKARLTEYEALPYKTEKEAQNALTAGKKDATKLSGLIDKANSDSKTAGMNYAAAKADLNTAKIQNIRFQKEAASADETFKAALSQYGFLSKEDFLANLKSEEDLQEEEAKIRSFQDSVRTTEVLLEKAKEEAKGLAYVDTGDLVKKRAELLSDNETDDELYRRVSGRYGQNKRTLADLKGDGKSGRFNELNDLVLDYRTKLNMKNLISGQYAGASRMTFEQYIQQEGFRQILEAANIRLQKITDGQFAFRLRSAEDQGKKSQEALALDIFDANTGKQRPIESVSGGEGFKASLSLALGLSDSIASRAGGISVESLFIDEGFGSLDTSESLPETIDMLTTLSTKNKLVGIISHCEALKSEISNQIVVTKSRGNSGSTLEVVRK